MSRMKPLKHSKVTVDNLSLSFVNKGQKPLQLIDNISFSIESGKTFALLGESGCGKSMTAATLMQLLPLNAFCHRGSSVRFDNTDLLAISERQMQNYRGVRLAMIFQEPMTSLNPVLTIGQQLSEVLKKVNRCSKTSLVRQALHLLEKVEIPEPKRRLKEYPHQLSGGQKQRVMIAMAIATNPDLLIADEPTTALDVTIQAQILSLLKKLTTELNMAMLLISHDLAIVQQVADKVGVMYAGQMVEYCATETFFKKAMHPYSRRLLACLPSIEKRGSQLSSISGKVPDLSNMPKGCRFLARCLKAQTVCQTTPQLKPFNNQKVRCHLPELAPITLVNLQSKPTAELSSAIEKAQTASPQNILKVSNLKIYYPIRKGLLKRQVNVLKAVDDVSFQIQQGETLALVGESGCGKTTLSRGICQLIEKTSGTIELFGKKIDSYNRQLANQLQIIFQDPFSSMDPRVLVEDILLEGLYAQQQEGNKAEFTNKAKSLLDMVGLPQNSLYRYPHEFSGGQRQRISIARALAVKPKLLICDEPTSALDVSIQAQILNLLMELQQELALSYLFISHDFSVVSYVADRIMVMKQGKIIEQGASEQIIKAPKDPYTKQLLEAVPTITFQ